MLTVALQLSQLLQAFSNMLLAFILLFTNDLLVLVSGQEEALNCPNTSIPELVKEIWQQNLNISQLFLDIAQLTGMWGLRGSLYQVRVVIVVVEDKLTTPLINQRSSQFVFNYNNQNPNLQVCIL